LEEFSPRGVSLNRVVLDPKANPTPLPSDIFLAALAGELPGVLPRPKGPLPAPVVEFVLLGSVEDALAGKLFVGVVVPLVGVVLPELPLAAQFITEFSLVESMREAFSLVGEFASEPIEFRLRL
jgi:hypothetical protein